MKYFIAERGGLVKALKEGTGNAEVYQQHPDAGAASCCVAIPDTGGAIRQKPVQPSGGPRAVLGQFRH
jgi:hypothetical protein